MFTRFLLTAALCLTLIAGNAQASIIINEFLADPASGLAGDANGDGVRSTSNDEFVELFNGGDLTVDLTAWLLGDSTKIRHVFRPALNLRPGVFLLFSAEGPRY